MTIGTLFFSKKVKAVIESDSSKLVKVIEDLIAKYTNCSATISVSGSIFASGDVSVNLFDIGNMAGYEVDLMALDIKKDIALFFLKRGLIINPLKIPVTSHVTVVN